jgi:tetratricopeptide (TPR) repeat protein
MFFQRHLCHAIQQNFWFMNRQWGVPDEAKKFAAQCDREFGALRLYPFVRRFNCTDIETYHKSVDDGFKVTVATPHLVPARCWNELCYKVRFAPLYTPNPNPHVNEWHSHDPPPGTVYDLGPRLDHPSLIDRPDALAHFEKLHELAPYDWGIAGQILTRKYQGHPTYDEAMALYGALLPYSVGALEKVACTVTNKPEQYERLMLQAAALNPACYYTLGDYVLDRKQEDKAAEYLEKACAADPDVVRVANHARWRVSYYLKKGQTEKAREIADQGGEVYSAYGLEAKGNFLEATTNYDEAFEWFAKIEERYGKSGPVLNFCLRYRAQTGDARFQPEVQKRIKTLFPKGIEKVAVQDFHGPPTDGVLILQENDLLKAAGLKAGDVIVAVYGVRVHNLQQYAYGRELKQTPELDLIVWHGDAYREFKPSPPRHRFGVDFGDYAAKNSKTR